MAKDWQVWLWKFDGRRAFVFVGIGVEGCWPDAVWQKRYEVNSTLTEELRRHDLMPYPESVLSFPTYFNRARAIKRSTEEALRRDGWKLLSARDKSTIVAGNLAPRPVYAMHWGRFSWFPSLAKAARALGVSEGAMKAMADEGLLARWDSCRK